MTLWQRIKNILAALMLVLLGLLLIAANIFDYTSLANIPGMDPEIATEIRATDFSTVGYSTVLLILSVVLLAYGIRMILFYFTMARHMNGGRSMLYRGILFTDLTVGKGYLLIADDPAQTVYLMGGRHLLVPETEAPGIDQRCYGDVEGAFGIGRYLHCLREHLDEIGVERHLTVLIDSRNHRLLVEW